MKLKSFTSDHRWWSFVWGSGHTSQTNPASNGWTIKPSRHTDLGVVLAGQRGVAGCFSAVLVPPLMFEGTVVAEAYVDVAVYDETPEAVNESWKSGKSLDAQYESIKPVPGWGLYALDLVKECRRTTLR